MTEDLVDDHQVFNAGNDFHGAAARRAGLNVDVEHPLESLRPGHGRAPFDRCLSLLFISCCEFDALAGRHQCSVLAIWRKHTVESGQVNTVIQQLDALYGYLHLNMEDGQLLIRFMSRGELQYDIKGGEIWGPISNDTGGHANRMNTISGSNFNANSADQYLIYTSGNLIINGGQFGYVKDGLGLFFDFGGGTIDIYGHDQLLVEDGLLTGYLRDDSWISLNVNFGDYWNGEFNIYNEPEPNSLALRGLGLAGISFARLKKT